MYSLTLLGSPDLRGPDGRQINSVLSQPKRLALLALLSLEAPRRLQRDELMAMLWPEVSDDRARNALRQSLYYLRRSLGPGVIAGKGEEGIGIADSRLKCDARELLDAAADARCGEVMERYTGELLPGFHLSDTPAPFERWLDQARRRVERCTLECAWRVADEAARSGNLAAAAVAARRAWDLEPWGEAALQKLLRILVDAGDVVGARAAYEEFAGRLEAEEQRSPKAATRAILEEAAEHPTERQPKAAPPAPPVAVESEPEWEPAPVAGGTGRRWRRDVPVGFWVGSSAVLTVLLLVVWAFLPAETARGAERGIGLVSSDPELALESVRDLADADRTSMRAEATTNELAARLAEAGSFRVILDRDPAPGGVRLRSTIQEGRDGPILAVLVLDGASNAVLDRLTVEAAGTERPVPEQLAARMAPKIRRVVGELQSWRGLAAERIRPEALAAIRTAAAELDEAEGLRRRGVREAAETGYEAVDSLLEHATELAPGWVEPRARRAELALEAMWLNLVPPHSDLAQAHRTILRGLDHAEAAVSVSPGPRSLDVRGRLLYWASSTAQDPDSKASYLAAAERDLERAVRMDADLPSAWSALSALAEKRGDHALAYQRARKAYDTDRSMVASVDILTRLFTNALEVGDGENAARWCQEIRDQQPTNWLGPYCDLSRLAWLGPWTAESGEKLVREGIERVPDFAGGEVLKARFRLLDAVVLARAGETSEAREILGSLDTADQSLEVLDLMAWARVALGESGRARQLLLSAAAMNPSGARRFLTSRRYADLAPYAVVRADQ